MACVAVPLTGLLSWIDMTNVVQSPSEMSFSSSFLHRTLYTPSDLSKINIFGS